jgi:GPH family glycoside/pentoside/hexuronide:cation symporter
MACLWPRRSSVRRQATTVCLLLLFYNQLLGLPAAAVGFVLGAAVVLDTIWNPIVGQLSDNTHSRWGRRHPYLYGVPVPLTLAFALLWLPPAGSPKAALLAWLAVFAVLTGLLISLYEIPSSALFPELARGYDARTRLLGYRYFFGTLGALTSAVLGFGVFLRSTPEHPFGQLNRAGYAPYGVTVAGICLAAMLVSALGTRRAIPQLAVPPARTPALRRLLLAIRQSLSSRNFAVLAVSGLLHGLNLGIHAGLGIYFATYFWKLPTEKLLWLGLPAYPAVIFAAIFTPVLAKRWGKKDTAIALFLCAITLGNLPLAAAPFGWMPPPGSAAQFAILLAATLVVSALGTGGFIAVVSMFAGIVDETELRTGRRSEGLLLAAVHFLEKLSAGTAVAVPGLMLALVGFPRHADLATLDPRVMRELAFVSLALGVLLSDASTCVLFFYRIDWRTHEANLARLALDFPGGYSRPGTPRGRIDDSKRIATA